MPAAYLVFSQSVEMRVDVGAWAAHGARFFATDLAPAGTGSVRVSPKGAEAGERAVRARARTDDDLDAATRADRDDSGLARLARRCPTVWIVERESDDDPVALRLAAIVASVVLGPILDRDAGAIFGVKTAREKLSRD